MKNNLKDELQNIKESIVRIIHKNMKSKGVGSLKKQLTVDSTDNGFVISGTDAVIFANSGRKPGKMPSTKSLESWGKKHNKPRNALFPIARKIGKEGTKGKFFLDDDNIDKLLNEATDKIANAFADDIKENINTI